MDHSRQVTNLQFRFSGSEYVFSPLMALVIDFLFGLYATIFPAGVIESARSVWLLDNDPFTCSVMYHSMNQLRKHPEET